ncbi:tetratricopeptide repeat protein [Paracoccus aurantiacus]|uniref:Tetratricopeptide repeat protein n=1 Tax=Paracoccus aurantiacus TaxID=2599412 RepID=A0A5C6S5V4_9RHOB|nr:tetratricopeptide repeat protein [Paracoccus aurantiacus]TXB69819.1 tetratricopeptide repeat protein [Paracoccus aurantiacus]
MSHDSDSFIDEVTEEVRRDRLYGLMRRYGWIGLVVILAIVLGAAWREFSTSRDRAAAQAWGDAVLAAQDSDDPVKALSSLDAGGNADRAALGSLLAAGAAEDAGDAATAATALESAAGTAQDPLLRDLARLKAVLAAGESMEPGARDAALAELSKPGAPFRLLALEQKAVALLAAGRDQDALTLIRETLAEDGVSQALASRLTQMMITLGAPPADTAAPASGNVPAAEASPVGEAAPAE